MKMSKAEWLEIARGKGIKVSTKDTVETIKKKIEEKKAEEPVGVKAYRGEY